MLVTSRNGGLLLCEEARPPREIAEQLRRVDSQLELRQDWDAAHGVPVWRVFHAQADKPSVWVFDWRERDGTPLPLTARIVDEAAAMRLDSRKPHIDVQAVNDAQAERDKAERLDAYATVAEEVLGPARVGRLACIKPSHALYMARARARREGRQQ